MIYNILYIAQAKPKAPRKSSRQSGRNSGNVTAPTIKQVLTHLNTFRQNGDKIKFGFYTPEEDQLEELKEMCDKCKQRVALQRIFINVCLVFTNDSILAALCQMRESADADERVEFTELFNLFNLSEEDSDKEVEEQPVRLLKIVVATDWFSSEANSKPFSNAKRRALSHGTRTVASD